jgi:6-pyruvoyl-tetrahydropterin synthase
MSLAWVDKYKEAKTLVELSYDSLRSQDIVSAVTQLQTAVKLYKEILDDSSLIPNFKKIVQDKLQTENEKLKALKRIVRQKTKKEIEKVSPKRKYTKTRKPK